MASSSLGLLFSLFWKTFVRLVEQGLTSHQTHYRSYRDGSRMSADVVYALTTFVGQIMMFDGVFFPVMNLIEFLKQQRSQAESIERRITAGVAIQ